MYCTAQKTAFTMALNLVISPLRTSVRQKHTQERVLLVFPPEL